MNRNKVRKRSSSEGNFASAKDVPKSSILPRSKSWNILKECKVCVTSRLKSELSWLRRKSAIKVGQEEPLTRTCGRCQTELGLLLNRGAFCSSCRQRVCKDCRKYGNFGKDWVCVVCSKQIEIQLATGEWLNEFIRRPSRRRDKNLITPSEGVRKTLVRRSWSISNPSTTSQVTREEPPPKRPPPLKPPRKSLTGDENVPPPWHDETQSKPSRRFSMSSFDAASSRRPNRGHSAPNSRGKSPEYRQNIDLNRRQQSVPKYYFFGSNDLLSTDKQRPSTLPRRPLQRPLSVTSVNLQDATRFHSMPRTKTTREQSPSVSRGHSVPAPFVSSGPVTNTLIRPSFNSLPRGGISISQDDIKVTPRKNFESLKSLGRANSSGEFWSSKGRRDNSAVVKLRDDEGGGGHWRRRVESKLSGHLPFDSGVSEISQNTSDEGSFSPHRTYPSRTVLPRSNTSITSGFASTGRTKKPAVETYVRRTQSFQAKSSKTFIDGDLSFPSRNGGGGGHVAKFVQQLEKGIHQTQNNNIYPRKTSDSLKETLSVCSRDSSSSASISREDGRHSNLSGSDVVLDRRKIIPEGEDYRLVFISSDSSKESEINSSVDSDNSIRVTSERPKLTNWKKRVEMNLSSPWKDKIISNMDSVPHESFVKREKRFVDVAVNTEEDYVSDDSTDSDAPNYSCYASQYDHLNVPLIPLGSLNPTNLKIMLQQTEVVQAEAQALQKALMGAFDTEVVVPSVTCRNSPEGMSTEGHFQPCHESRNISKSLFATNDAASHFDYVNIRSDLRQKNNLYENIPPARKNICIQTDLGPPSWEDDNETSDNSDMSSDDSVNQKIHQNSFNSHNDVINARNIYTIMNRGQLEHTSGKAPPFYLPSTPPLPPYSQSTVHLQSDSSSVSLSSECESVRKVFDVVRGHSGVILKPKCSISDREKLINSDFKKVDHKSDNIIRAIESDVNKRYVTTRAFQDVPTINFSGLIGGGSQFNSSEFQAIKMNVIQSQSSCSKESESDVNAVEEVIPSCRIISGDTDTQIHNDFEKTSSCSSGTSEGDDTDEEIHVSRSYDVSQPNESGSNRASDVDEEKQHDVDTQRVPYPNESDSSPVQVLTPTPSDSESENNNLSNENDERMCDQVPSETIEKTELPECDQAIDDCVVEGPIDLNENHARFQRSDSRSDCENIENKSETESTLGLDADLDPIKEDCHSSHENLMQDKYKDTIEDNIINVPNQEKIDPLPLNQINETENSKIASIGTFGEPVSSDLNEKGSSAKHDIKINVETVTNVDQDENSVVNINLEENNTNIDDKFLEAKDNIAIDEGTDQCAAHESANNEKQNILSDLDDNTDSDKTFDKIPLINTVKDLSSHKDDSSEYVPITDDQFKIITEENEQHISHGIESYKAENNYSNVLNNQVHENVINNTVEIPLKLCNDTEELELTEACVPSPSPCSTIHDSECIECEITGTTQVERVSANCINEAVTLADVNEEHELFLNSHENQLINDQNTTNLIGGDIKEKKIEVCVDALQEKVCANDKIYSSESGHSSGGESEGDLKEIETFVKIDIAENIIKKEVENYVIGHVIENTVGNDVIDNYITNNVIENNDIKQFIENNIKKYVLENNVKNNIIENNAKNDAEWPVPIVKYNASDVNFKKSEIKKISGFSKGFLHLRKAKRSSSTEGLSSSSDIERSDADASDSADTVIDNKIAFSKINKNKKISEDFTHDSDGPSSADSLLHGADSESQCSDGSEEGNLVTIVAVGEDSIPKQCSQGKIYIHSDSTDSDVQIKPTCIIVSGFLSDEEDDNEERGDVTILEVKSEHRTDHVMSVRVTSPESSRNASPTRKSNVSELQSMILTHRERQQHIHHSPVEGSEMSSLTNYFTVTLGTESPLTPRRTNKTPEVRRRKLTERTDTDSPSSTPTLAATPTPTLTPSPSHTPSPTDHSEGDLLAYEEHHKAGIVVDPFLGENQFCIEEKSDEYYEVYQENEQYGDFHEETDGPFDSIEDAESLGDSNFSETSSEEGYEREEELRGYCKRGCDFTLHTIIEESCEESDYDKKAHEDGLLKRDQSELEKYFYFGLGNGPAETKKYANEESEYSDTYSETSSSIFSEGMESIDGQYDNDMDPAELASSRLEKYFSGFAGFERQPSFRSVGEESEIHTDESGSVGSDSEGSPSPEQPRKKLFKSSKSRGVRSISSTRSYGYSSDKGESGVSDCSMHSMDADEEKNLVSSDNEVSTESEETAFDKGDGQFDTIKRRKKKKLLELDKKADNEKMELKLSESKSEEFGKKSDHLSELDAASKKYSFDEPKSPKEIFASIDGDLAGRKYQSRDSGFIGSSDDLLKDKPDENRESELKDKPSSESGGDETEINKNNGNSNLNLLSTLKHENYGSSKTDIEEKSSNEGKVSRSSTGSSVDLPPYIHSKGSQSLSRKDSFNNWSSDEETNIMMNKMRLFFKNMFSSGGNKEVPKAERVKAPQLVMFEARLTNLMRSVPGINDEQVKEIVEYLSSEDTWSDSYDSSDYTSSDLEGAYARLDQTDPELKSALQEQISLSCRQIIKKFDLSREPSDNDSAHSIFGRRTGSETSDSSSMISKDAAFVYHKLMSSISNMKQDSDRGSIGSGSQSTSPPLLMKVIHHIGNRIVALMHEVSAGSDIGDDNDSLNGGIPLTSSPRQKLFLPKKYDSGDSSIDKSSLASGSFDSEDSHTDTEQSPESETATPKMLRNKKLSIISERSSADNIASFDSRKMNASIESSRPHYTKSSQSSQTRSRWHGLPLDVDKFDGRDHHVGLPKMSRSGKRSDPRKAKSHMSLEKIQYDDMKTTGERSESLGDLLDRVRSSSEFSSSYEHLDSDSTLKASDSLDRQIGSSSSNVRLNASSRGSLTTSSRGSLATSSRGSLQGSSGAEEDEDRKNKKLSFFRYARRSSVPDATKDNPSPEMRSTTLPRSTPAHILTTGTLPRSESSNVKALSTTFPYFSSADKPSTGYPRSARYHPPGYRPPPAGLPPKRTYSTPTLRKEPRWPVSEESGACVDDISASSSAITSGGGTSRTPWQGVASNGSSRAASPLGGSLGRTSGTTGSVGGSLASFETFPEEAKRRNSTDRTRSPLIALGLTRRGFPSPTPTYSTIY